MADHYVICRMHFGEDSSMTLPELVRPAVSGGHDFQLIMQKEGILPLDVFAGCHRDVLGALSSVVCSCGPGSSVEPASIAPVPAGAIGIVMEKVGLSGNTADSLIQALRSLVPGEWIRIVLHVKPASAQTETVFAGVIAFAKCVPGRLAALFPQTMTNGYWKVLPTRKTSPILSAIPLSALENLFPLIEKTGPDRRSFPLGCGNMKFEGVHVITPSGHHPLTITDNFFTKNTLVFGGTGSGKSTFLHWLSLSLIKMKRAACIIDPHGTLARGIMHSALGRGMGNRILYVDPVRSPVGLNPFETLRIEMVNDEAISMLTESIGNAIRVAFGSEYWGPRLDYLLSQVVGAVAPIHGSNFADVLEIMKNPPASRQLAGSTTDESVRDFLLSVMPGTPKEWWMSAIDKIGRIVSNVHARNILCRRNGNANLRDCVSRGALLLLNLDMRSMGQQVATLVGSMIVAMYWTVASSASGATIIVDEAQLFPSRILESIASQGRKFGVNIVLATQSPSMLGRQMLASMNSNFSNRVVLHLDGEDAKIAGEFLVHQSKENIQNLEALKAIIRCDGSTGTIMLDPVCAASEEMDKATAVIAAEMSCRYEFRDDALPSRLAALESSLFDALQLASMAEVQGKTSLSGIQESGILHIMGYTPTDMAALVEKARSFRLIQRGRRIRLTEKGRQELIRLQGGVLAGGQRHREMLLRLKSVLDSFQMPCYIPRQEIGVEKPDLIAVDGNSNARLLHLEMELSTKHRLELRRRKIERARAAGAIPVFVFDKEDCAKAFVKNVEFRDVPCFWMNGIGLRFPGSPGQGVVERKEQFMEYIDEAVMRRKHESGQQQTLS